MNSLQFRGRFTAPQVHLLKEVTMAVELTFAKKNGSQNFRIRTASTKVTQSEFAELEHAAAEQAPAKRVDPRSALPGAS